MDRNRLKEVHTSDLSESRINEDFLTWLQTKGPTYLLVVLIICCGYVFWVRWKASNVSHEREAWNAFQTSQLPSAYEDVARQYTDVGAVAPLARMTAAQILLNSVQSNKALSAGDGLPLDLTAEDRTSYLDRADALFGQVVDGDDNTPSMTLIIVGALNGRAAIAESKGDAESARTHYEAAATRADGEFPDLAAQARHRIETIAVASSSLVFPTDEQLAVGRVADATQPKRGVTILDAVQDYVGPTASK